jgi:hypothetical protein
MVNYYYIKFTKFKLRLTLIANLAIFILSVLLYFITTDNPDLATHLTYPHSLLYLTPLLDNAGRCKAYLLNVDWEPSTSFIIFILSWAFPLSQRKSSFSFLRTHAVPRNLRHPSPTSP